MELFDAEYLRNSTRRDIWPKLKYPAVSLPKCQDIANLPQGIWQLTYSEYFYEIYRVDTIE